MKHMEAMESLKHPFSKQILNVEATTFTAYQVCQALNSFNLQHDAIADIATVLELRFRQATSQESRAFYYFVLLSPTRLGMKRISADIIFSLEVALDEPAPISTL